MTRRRVLGVAAALERDAGAQHVAVCLLLALARALRSAPQGTIDDVIALLAAEDLDDGRRRR